MGEPLKSLSARARLGAALPAHYRIGHTELIEDLYSLVEGPQER